jgi:hypothetical protein
MALYYDFRLTPSSIDPLGLYVFPSLAGEGGTRFHGENDVERSDEYCQTPTKASEMKR